MAKKPNSVLDCAVEFGGVSIGDATARLGVRISRDVLKLVDADEIFCGHRLTSKVILGHRDSPPEQRTFVEDLDYEVEGTFDVKRIGVTVEQISTGLTFSLADIEVADLAKFSKGVGRLVVYNVAAIPEDAPDEDNDEAPSTLRADGPWKNVSLDTLFHGQIRTALAKAGIDTVGDLNDFTATGKELTEITGIGPGKAEKIADRLVEFWKTNPQYAETPAAEQPELAGAAE